ncbi:MAG: cyclic pyranopterin monophosphate synthase MoaC [Polyangiaceae bacterium]|nr:cyclic pyranopterin monophosphate synthase MoaC [Polyangiaceae bacterium]
MVPVADKPATHRRAVAAGSVRMRPETVARIVRGGAPEGLGAQGAEGDPKPRASKGDLLAAARIAGIMAAKRTPDLIPLCHGVALTHVAVSLDVDEPAAAVHVTATAEAVDRTGVEMEAMVAVSAACLTLYDMLKGIDREMVLTDIRLLEKSGGRSGHFQRSAP